METKKNHHRLLLLPAALFLVLLAGIVAGAWYYYQIQETHFKAKVRDELSAVANLKMDQIAAWRKERLADAELLSKGGLLTSEMAPNEKIRDRFRRLGPLLAIYKKDFGYYSLIVTDIGGRVLQNIGGASGAPLYVDTAAILQAVSEKKTKVVDFYRCPACGRIHLDVLVPIFAGNTGRAVAGVAVLRRDPADFLFPLIQSWPTPSKTSETLLLRQEGDSILYLNELRHRKGAALKLRFPLDAKDLPAAQVVRGEQGFMEGTDYRGVKVFAVGRHIPDSPWYIIAKVDKEEALTPLRSTGRSVVVMGGLGAVIIFSLLVMWWMSYDRRMLLARHKEEMAREKAEEGLLESEERFRVAAETANDLIYEWDLKQSVEWFGKIDEILGYAPGEFPKTLDGWAAALHPEDSERVMAEVQAHLKGRAPYASEYRIRMKDGVYRCWSARGAVVKSPAGKPYRWVGTVTDITERKRSEESLKESEEKFRTIFDSSNVGKSITYLNGGMHVNRAFCEMVGYTKEELTDEKWQQITHPDDVELTQNNIELLRSGKLESTRFIKRFIKKNGDVFWADVSSVLQRDRNNKPLYLITAVIDITERKRAEETIKTSEERFRTAAQNLTDVVYDWDIKEKVDWYGDIDGIMGYPPGEFPRTVDGWAATIHLDDKDRVMAALEGHLKNRTPYVIEYRVGRRDGDWRWWSARGTALRDNRGEPYKMIGSISDITERKNAEEALRESESKYRTLVENIPQKILMKDRNYRWVSINENLARDFGFRPEEVVGKADADLFSSELAAKYHADDVRVMETGKTEAIEEKYIQEGRETWVNTIKTPVRDASGVIVGVLGVFWDITDRKHAEQEIVRLNNDLLQKNAELEQLVYIASHDLRSPLVNVQGFSKEMGLLVDELGKIASQAGLPAKQQSRLSDIVSKEFPEAQNYVLASVVKMDALLKGLLKLSRLGRTAITLQKIDMNEMLSNVLKTMEFQIKKNKVRVDIAALPACTSDPDQINQVFTNIIDNAIKYLSPDRTGVILITGKTVKDGFSEYCIEDNGIGIAPEHQPKAFEIFHRLNPQTGEGEGLGLAIVKKIVSRLNGSVRLESVLGKGCRFIVTLPGA